MENNIIKQALNLLEPFEVRYYQTLDNVHWVEKDGCSCDYDYCSQCIKSALYEERKSYLLEQRKLPISQRDKKFSEFTYTYNYGGGYEEESFICCENCGKQLDVSILPNRQNLEDMLDDLKDGIIDNCIGWKASSLLYNQWGDTKGKEHLLRLTLKLAERVMEIF